MMGYLTPKRLIEKPRCECWISPSRWRNHSTRCTYMARYTLPDGTKCCGRHANNPTPTTAWIRDPDAYQRAADLRAARRALIDFEKRGGKSLDELKRELGLAESVEKEKGR